MIVERDQRIAAFEEFYHKHYICSLKYTVKKVQNESIAEDIVSTAFLYCFEHFAEFDPGKAGFATWLYLVINSRIKNYYRDKKNTVELDEISNVLIDTAASVEDAIELTRLRGRLANALRELSEIQRRIVILRLIVGYPSKRVAEITGLSDANVRAIQSRAIAKLKNILDVCEK